MYVPMYHLLKKTRTLLDALKQDGRHLSKLKLTYKGLCEDSAKQWSDTGDGYERSMVMDGQIMRWAGQPHGRLGVAEINWELIMGGKGYAYDHICAAAKWYYYLATANSIAMILLCNDCTLPLPAAATAQSIPACFLIPSLHGYHQFWLLMVSPIICKKAWLYMMMMMMNYLWMIIDRHGRDELKPLSLFTSACRIKQTVKFSHRKCFFFFFTVFLWTLISSTSLSVFKRVFPKSSAR